MIKAKLVNFCIVDKNPLVVKNANWWQSITKKVIYAGLPRISTTIGERRLRFSGHCWRSTNEVVSDLVSCEPKHGKRSVGGQARTFVGGGHRGLQRLLAGSDGRQGWQEKKSHGRSTEVDLVVVAVVVVVVVVVAAAATAVVVVVLGVNS